MVSWSVCLFVLPCMWWGQLSIGDGKAVKSKTHHVTQVSYDLISYFNSCYTPIVF